MSSNATVLDISEFREKTPRKKAKINKNKKGSVYVRGPKLWVMFSYLGERIREPTGLPDTPENKSALRLMLDKIHIEIAEGSLEFQRRFPYSKKAAYFTKLEGRTKTIRAEDLTISAYWTKWYKAMEPGMSMSKRRDYNSAMNSRLLPHFGGMAFSEINSVAIKAFVAGLTGEGLAPNTIHNLLKPLRAVINDAISEYNFAITPFSGVKLPAAKKTEVSPFTQSEWLQLINEMVPHYRLYFRFAVATGLRPSEQVALKWSSVHSDRVEVEASIVRGHKKNTLKTESSRRTLWMRPEMETILKQQREISGGGEYVFVNMKGKPIDQDTLAKGAWRNALKRSGLKHRRMYETRHTFVSWALAAGEQSGWVADVVGHSNLDMIYRVYGRFVPGFRGADGGKIGTILGTISNTETQDP